MMLGIGLGLNKNNNVQRSGNDPTVQNFITAYSITDQTQIDALNYLIRTFKGAVNAENPTGEVRWQNGIYDIAPVIGGSMTKHRGGLKTATDIITFSGGITHNANGYTGNAISGTATFIYAPADLGMDTAGYAHYTRNIRAAGTKASMGVYTTSTVVFEIYPRYTADILYTGVNGLESVGTPNTLTKGFMGISRLSSTQYNELLQSSVNLVPSVSGTPSTDFICNLCFNVAGAKSQFNSDNICTVLLYNAPVTAALRTIDAAVIQQYNTILSRNV